ncbi:hypothetical protein EBR96_08735, partial [bacterium]|nr:hypothetical protein [bacterium]
MTPSPNFHLTQFLNFLSLQRRLSPHTVSAYKRDIRQALESIQKPVDRIDFQDCYAYLESKTVRRLDARSIARHLAALRTFWQFLMTHEIVAANPWKSIPSPRLKFKLPKVVDSATIGQILDRIDDESPENIRLRAIAELLFGAGIRIAELIGLTPSDIHFETGEIRVTGKGNRERIALFSPIVGRWLTRYLTEVRPLWASPESTAVFINQRGGRLSARSIQTWIRKLAADHRLEGRLTPHTFRHSFATSLYEGG